MAHRPLARALAPLYAAALAVLVLDQLSKAWIVATLGTEPGAYVRLLGDLVWLRLVHNRGAAFGVLPAASVVFALAAVGVALGIVLYSRRLGSASLLIRVALGLELGGAVGNLFDRLRFGYVVDFVDVRLWPYVFNVADAAISIGVVLLLLTLLPQRAAPSRSELTAHDRTA